MSLRHVLLLGLAVFGLHLSAAPLTSCEISYTRLLENRLVTYFTGKTNPLHHPKNASTVQDLARRQQAVEADLATDGVKSAAVSAEEQKDRGLLTALDYYVGTGDVPKPISAEPTAPTGSATRLVEVLSVTPQKRGPGDAALLHEGTPEILDRMKKIGVRVYVDSSLVYTGAGGLYWVGKKAIYLAPGQDFRSLVHEATHAEFDHYQVARFADRARELLSLGQDPSVLLTDADHAGFGEPRLRQVLDWVGQGYPNNSINEGLAVASEIAIYKGRDYVGGLLSGRFATSRAYAATHRLNDLIRLAVSRELTPPERKLLGQTLGELWSGSGAVEAGSFRGLVTVARYEWHTDARGAAKRLVVRTGVTVSPAATLVGVLFHKELGQAIAWMSDGSVVEWAVGDGDDKKKKKPE